MSKTVLQTLFIWFVEMTDSRWSNLKFDDKSSKSYFAYSKEYLLKFQLRLIGPLLPPALVLFVKNFD